MATRKKRAQRKPSSEPGGVTTTLVPENLEEVLHELGLDLGRTSQSEVWALCPNPNHDDSRPNSFSVNRDTGDSYCFACGYQRNLTGIVADVLRVGVWEASGWLREHGATFSNLATRSIEGKRERRERRRSEQREISSYREFSLEARFGVFQDAPDGMLELRRLTREAVDAFEIRWDPKERCWIIPARLPEGDLIGWQIKGEGVFKNYPYKMPRSQTLFGFREIEDASPLVVVESPLDVPRVWDAGYDCVATWGARFSSTQVGLIQQAVDEHAGTVVLAMDHDEEGMAANAELSREFKGVPVRVIDYTGTRAKDVGEMRREEIQERIDAATSAFANPLPLPDRRKRVKRVPR